MPIELPTFLDKLDAKLSRHIEAGFVDSLDPRDLRAMLQEAREAKAGEMPEGFHIGSDGNLYAKTGLVFTKDELFRYGPDTIRRAVDAWLASMKERGNG